MNLESQLVFITGPGGAGKSTAGNLLASKLGYQFVDLDAQFNQRVGIIPEYIRDHGYRAYTEANSKLFADILFKNLDRTVIALSSGFLAHEDSPDIVSQNKQMLDQNGVTILLLPSQSLEVSLDVIIPRQLRRGFTDIVEEQEKIRLATRHPQYLQFGDIQIFSHDTPEKIVEMMTEELNSLGLPK